MADTTFLKKTLQPYVVQWVAQRLQVPLVERSVIVGPRTDGTLVHFAFDGVSPDGRVGVLVSASRTTKSGGWRKLAVDASILLNAPFEKRVMVFVYLDVKDNLLKECDGLLALRKIDMMVCEDLPSAMRAGLDQFHAAAPREVGDKGRQPRKRQGLRR